MAYYRQKMIKIQFDNHNSVYMHVTRNEYEEYLVAYSAHSEIITSSNTVLGGGGAN